MQTTTPTVVTDRSRLHVTNKRTFPYAMIGTSEGFRAKYNEDLAADEIDYCWLNAEAMVLDNHGGVEKPKIETPYGTVIEIDGYGQFAIGRPGPMDGDHAQLLPVGREETSDQERAVADLLARPGVVGAQVSWAVARVPGERMSPGEGVQRVVANAPDAEAFTDRQRTYHVYPDGTTRRVVIVGEYGKKVYLPEAA